MGVTGLNAFPDYLRTDATTDDHRQPKAISWVDDHRFGTSERPPSIGERIPIVKGIKEGAKDVVPRTGAALVEHIAQERTFTDKHIPATDFESLGRERVWLIKLVLAILDDSTDGGHRETTLFEPANCDKFYQVRKRNAAARRGTASCYRWPIDPPPVSSDVTVSGQPPFRRPTSHPRDAISVCITVKPYHELFRYLPSHCSTSRNRRIRAALGCCSEICALSRTRELYTREIRHHTDTVPSLPSEPSDGSRHAARF